MDILNFTQYQNEKNFIDKLKGLNLHVPQFNLFAYESAQDYLM